MEILLSSACENNSPCHLGRGTQCDDQLKQVLMLQLGQILGQISKISFFFKTVDNSHVSKMNAVCSSIKIEADLDLNPSFLYYPSDFGTLFNLLLPNHPSNGTAFPSV